MRRFATWIAVGSILLITAFASGYVISSSWGRELLRRAVEQILSDVMQGEVEVDEVRVVLSNGFGLYGRGLRAYPSERGPGLQAQEAYIELNEPAALLGEFELALLVLDEVVLQASLLPDGVWTFPPLQSLQSEAGRAEEGEEEPAEPVLTVLAGAERVARVLLEEDRIADRIVINRGAIHFEDYAVIEDARAGTGLQRFHLQHIEGMLTRPWLSEEGQLALTATFVDPNGTEVPVRWTAFVLNGELEIALAAADLDLDAFDAYVQRLAHGADLEGTVSGEVRLETAEPGYQHVVVDLALQDVTTTVVLGEERLLADLPMEILQAHLEIEPGVARLVDARMGGAQLALEAFASVVRPVSWAAPARIEVQLSGLAVRDVGRIADQLPHSGGEVFGGWLGRIESGRVDGLSISGSTTLGTWGQLLGGKLAVLPPGFLLGLRVSDVTVRLDEDDRLTYASLQADWAGDRLEIHRGQGDWKGAPLPEINLTIDGLSRFVGMQPSSHGTDAEPLPGLALAWDLLLEDHEADEASSNRFQVDIDYIDHPVLGWPIENAHMTVQPIPHGTEFVLTQGTWGGFPIIAEIVYLLHPEPVVTVGLQAGVAGAPASASVRPVRRATRGGPWGQGRFRLEPASVEPEEPSLLSHMDGEFQLTGSTIRFTDSEVTVSQSAHIAAKLAIDLGEADRLSVEFEGRIDDADMDHLGVAVGLPEGFITGKIDIDADIEGSLSRGQNLFAGLYGTIHGEADDGEIRQSVPLAVAMATATDGFNPFSKRDRLKYETIETDIVLDRGRLTAEKIELEGPVRIYASGTLDFAEPPQEIDAVVGVFLFQRVRELLGKVPLVNLVLPGSDNGLVGAYFRVYGPWDEPEVETMALKSLQEGVPDIITKPFEMLHSLWKGSGKKKEEKSTRRKKEPTPS